jgi:glycosyltransferase involved in cell wall biosynthesis
MLPVVIFTNRLYPSYGAARVALDLAKGLSALRPVTVVTFEGERDSNFAALSPDIAFLQIRRGVGPFAWVLLAIKLGGLMKSFPRGSTVVSLMTFANLSACLASALANRRFDVVATEHNIQSKALPGMGRSGWIALHLMPVAYRWARRVVAVSDAVSTDLVAKCGVPESKVLTILNPIDIDRIVELAGLPLDDELKELAGIGNVACIAELKPAKRQETLIRAFAQVADKNRKLLLIGDGESRDSLQSIVEEIGLTSQVVFLGRLENPWPLVSKIGATVLVPFYEGFGLVAAESAAVGTPPIGLAVNGLAEVLAAVGGESILGEQDLVADLAGVLNSSKFATGAGKSAYEVPVGWFRGRAPLAVAGEYLDRAIAH